MVDAVVDLQFGSTGKGKVCAWLARRESYNYAVRVQSIQAGHTIYHGETAYKMRTIPCAWVNPETILLLGPGCFIEKELLLAELEMLKDFNVRERLYLDYRAFYITEEDKAVETGSRDLAAVGSCKEGAGSSLVRKIMRGEATRVIDDGWAAKQGLTISDTVELIQNKSVLLEGCQGAMLGLHTSPYYPYVTGRECSVAAIMGEAGIAPADIKHVYGVFRTFPIRVGGPSGPTGGEELDWRDFAIEPEITTVTGRQRRIFTFSYGDFRKAMIINKPDKLVLTFLDYIDPKVYEKGTLTRKASLWLDAFEKQIGREIDVVGTGPKTFIER